jgi:acyl carrier protein
MDIEKDIREFIVENFLYGAKDVELKENDSFIEMGIIDSTGVMELVNFLEGKFGITFNDDELTPDNLDSVLKIFQFVNSKIGSC